MYELGVYMLSYRCIFAGINRRVSGITTSRCKPFWTVSVDVGGLGIFIVVGDTRNIDTRMPLQSTQTHRPCSYHYMPPYGSRLKYDTS